MKKQLQTLLILAFYCFVSCHKIDLDCLEQKPILAKDSKEAKYSNLPYVHVKIVRSTDLVFPLPPDHPDEETVKISANGNVNVTFNGGTNHTQEYNPRQLFLSFNGSSVYGAMGTYSKANGSVSDEVGCINWLLEVEDFINKTKSQIYGEELNWVNISDPFAPLIPVITQDIVRLEVIDPELIFGPDYDNECAIISQYAREEKSNDVQTKEQEMITFRHVQLKYDLLGQEVSNNVVKTYSFKNVTGTEVFGLEIPSFEQMPDEIKVSHNLSLSISETGFLTSSIAFVEYFEKAKWQCNIENLEPSKLFETKLYFSHFQGKVDGDYTRVVDFVEFYESKANRGLTLKCQSHIAILIFLTAIKFIFG